MPQALKEVLPLIWTLGTVLGIFGFGLGLGLGLGFLWQRMQCLSCKEQEHEL